MPLLGLEPKTGQSPPRGWSQTHLKQWYRLGAGRVQRRRRVQFGMGAVRLGLACPPLPILPFPLPLRLFAMFFGAVLRVRVLQLPLFLRSAQRSATCIMADVEGFGAANLDSLQLEDVP